MRFRKLWPAAAAAAATTIPVGLALAAERPPAPTSVSPNLRAPLAGDATAAEAMRDHVRDDLVRRHVRLSHRLAQVGGPGVSRRAALERTVSMSARRLQAENSELGAAIRELDVPIPPLLEKIAQCESHGNPKATGGGGTFRGKYQFMQSTWESLGGKGDPAAAPEAEQDRRAAMLLARSGPGQWPVCGA